jgi:predicted dithiol-disulfide oxidoreductase (DUF899 family)
MTIPTAVVSEQEWNSQRDALLVKEQQLTGARRAGHDAGMKIASSPERGCPGCTMFADTTRDDSADFDVSEWFGINVFLRDGDQIYRSYYTTAQAAEEPGSLWALPDITPFGRPEEFQGAPEGVPQDRTGSWVRRHEAAGGRS